MSLFLSCQRRLASISLTLLIATPSLAGKDETPAYINALTTYTESKVIDDSGLKRIIDACTAAQIANPYTREVARTSTDKLLAFETLQDYIDSAELDASRVCAWAKQAQANSRKQQEEREGTRQETVKVFEEAKSGIISAGESHTYVVTSKGFVRCWGHPCQYFSSQGVLSCHRNFFDPECNIPTDLGEVRSVSAGKEHICAVAVNGTGQCWSFDDRNYGRVDNSKNLGAVKSVSAGFGFFSCAVKMDDTCQCWAHKPWQTTTVPSDLGEVRSISSGSEHTCVVKTDRTVRCWAQSYSLNGRPDPTLVPLDLGQVRSVSAGGYHNCAVKLDGTVQCWGDNQYGQTDVPSDLGPVRSVSAGFDHTCAVKENDTVKCWGKSDHGRTSVPPDLGKVRFVSAGTDHTCAVKEDGTSRCWGCNLNGQADAPHGYLFGFECPSTLECLKSWWNFELPNSRYVLKRLGDGMTHMGCVSSLIVATATKNRDLRESWWENLNSCWGNS